MEDAVSVMVYRDNRPALHRHWDGRFVSCVGQRQQTMVLSSVVGRVLCDFSMRQDQSWIDGPNAQRVILCTRQRTGYRSSLVLNWLRSDVFSSRSIGATLQVRPGLAWFRRGNRRAVASRLRMWLAGRDKEWAGVGFARTYKLTRSISVQPRLIESSATRSTRCMILYEGQEKSLEMFEKGRKCNGKIMPQRSVAKAGVKFRVGQFR